MKSLNHLRRSLKLFLLAPFLVMLLFKLQGCVGSPLGPGFYVLHHIPLLVSSASHAVWTYQSIPGHLELQKETNRPFTSHATDSEVRSVLVDKTFAYEGLTDSRVFEDVKITKAGTQAPRIADEASQLARSHGTDAYFMIDQTGMSGSGEYGRARIRMVTNEDKIIYDQTLKIVRKRSRHGDIPSQNEMERMMIQGFLDDLREHVQSASDKKNKYLVKSSF